MYVQCDISTYYVRDCAPGTLWNQNKKACDHPKLTTCSDDACASLSSGAFYVHNHDCQKYWVCSAGQTIEEGCCPEGQGFNSQTSKCEVDPNCIMTCNGKENQCRSTSPFCHLKDVQDDKHAYLEPATIDGQDGFVRKECGPRTMFNVSLCVCVHDPEQQNYDCSSAATEPDEELTFNTIQKSASYEGVALTDSVSGVDDKAGEFTGSGRVIWWRFANSGFSHNNTVLRLRVQPGQLEAGKEYAIISNADCNKTASLSITMTTNKIIFNIRSEYSDQKKTQEINYSASQNEWIEIELRYIRQSARGYSYIGYIKGNGGRQNTDELVIDGPIGTRACALQVGAHGSASIEDFLGYVDWVRVWDRCAPAEL
ncbi:uncharacterized protein LOC121369348 [Gigantopelta aegis]|uniref:uncharacterized protein LOC121369348 n=1 Tax=Gigantopelta aegis TaxID=1735272 RepID=UPI001B88CBAB|nr:uncharacterized protein LOC121369348 [Gigantopelta aegis]